MIEIQASEVPGKIEEILQRVEQGEEFEITRGGKRVAHISPPAQRDDEGNDFYDRLLAYKKKVNIGTVEEIMQWKNER